QRCAFFRVDRSRGSPVTRRNGASSIYTMFRIAPTAFLTLRNEFYDDIVGSRTGHATKYSEHSLGVTWWPNKIITLRPELRFDHSYDTPAFDNGSRRNQLTASMDFIVHY